MANNKKKSSLKDNLFFIVYNLIIVVCFLSVFELILSFYIKNPEKIPSFLLKPMQEYYTLHLRNTIQMDSVCACYNPRLFYTLRPGSCDFNNVEFKTHYKINSKGLRDRESALDSARIIFLGDSFTMGWGVSQDSTYASVFERISGIPTLNAGISSYGTVRELELLSSIGTPSVETIFIQYHASDLDENKEFQLHGDSLVISSKEKYEETQAEVENRKSYFWGRHTALLLKYLLKDIMGRLEDRRLSNQEDVDYFLNAIDFYRPQLEGKKVYIFEVASHNAQGSQFIPILKNRIQQDTTYSFLNVIDTRSVLSNNDYYILDDHINADGQNKLGQYLSKVIE